MNANFRVNTTYIANYITEVLHSKKPTRISSFLRNSRVRYSANRIVGKKYRQLT